MSTIQCRSCGTDVKEGMKFCPECGSALSAPEKTETAEKKAPKPKVRIIATGILAVVLIGGLSAYFGTLFREYHPVIEKQPELVVELMYGVEQEVRSQPVQATISNGFITIPLESVRSNKLVRFFDPEGVQSIPMIAYITPEGKLVTAMSKSENCQSTDFYLKGHNIHCASCPSYWNMSSLEAYACCQRFYPDPVPSSLVDNEIRIDAQLVRSWHPRG
ncbi:MAG: Fe-S-containing protein [Ignavibacteriae bacterium]|nr:Fe-S-containing protein [Ignavibacteriota bacterium]